MSPNGIHWALWSSQYIKCRNWLFFLEPFLFQIDYGWIRNIFLHPTRQQFGWAQLESRCGARIYITSASLKKDGHKKVQRRTRVGKQENVTSSKWVKSPEALDYKAHEPVMTLPRFGAGRQVKRALGGVRSRRYVSWSEREKRKLQWGQIRRFSFFFVYFPGTPGGHERCNWAGSAARPAEKVKAADSWVPSPWFTARRNELSRIFLYIHTRLLFVDFWSFFISGECAWRWWMAAGKNEMDALAIQLPIRIQQSTSSFKLTQTCRAVATQTKSFSLVPSYDNSSKYRLF